MAKHEVAVSLGKRVNPLALVSIVVPAFNEEALIEQSVRRIIDYCRQQLGSYRSELIVVNDGSTDGTGRILGRLSAEIPELHVCEHPANRGVGVALKTGFARARGDYVISLDADLSYDVGHIGEMVDKLEATHADLVLASPYMRHGTVRNVPLLRKLMSQFANFLLAKLSQGKLTTYTCMVRGYRRKFLDQLVLRATDLDIMPEAIYKTQVLKGKIEEVPAALDWRVQNDHRDARRSSMRVYSHILGTALTGFMVRPFVFLLLPGMVFGLLALYCGVWMVVHIVEAYPVLGSNLQPSGDITEAVAVAFARSPHTFVIGMLSLIVAIQLFGLALLALQSKKYFEHLFYLSSRLGGTASGVDRGKAPPD